MIHSEIIELEAQSNCISNINNNNSENNGLKNNKNNYKSKQTTARSTENEHKPAIVYWQSLSQTNCKPDTAAIYTLNHTNSNSNLNRLHTARQYSTKDENVIFASVKSGSNKNSNNKQLSAFSLKKKAIISSIDSGSISSNSIGNNNGNGSGSDNNTISDFCKKLLITTETHSNYSIDHENAFLRIENVHNYAKQQRYSFSNDSESDLEGNYDGDDDDNDEELDDTADAICEEDANIICAYDEGVNFSQNSIRSDTVNLYLGHTKPTNVTEKMATKKALIINNNNANVDHDIEHEEDSDVDIDVENLPHKVSSENLGESLKDIPTYNKNISAEVISIQHRTDPEFNHNNARRPMNAFLIFCKRHRAIVKERYQSLENRAITKILGDWWASLNDMEKHCFTNLAQKNKDAFFNANPNFKWYKLPAPPLRTLATRPSNAGYAENNQQFELDKQIEPNKCQEIINKLEANYDIIRNHQQLREAYKCADAYADTDADADGHYFKLAEETQMGKLSSLIRNDNDKNDALQLALSETTHFLSTHIPQTTINNNNNDNWNKKRNSASPNSTEEDDDDNGVVNGNDNDEYSSHVPRKKLKTTRRCKGKIYQELIKSGQIAALAKKFKNPIKQVETLTTDTIMENIEQITKWLPNSEVDAASLIQEKTTNNCRSLLECSNTSETYNDDHTNFDLEQKIKQLPVLSLDTYLQRKRNSSKKKKFNKKKTRNANSVLNKFKIPDGINKNEDKQNQQQPQAQQQQQQKHVVDGGGGMVVGSQKRKARKESITRRDVSVIEQENASIMPLTINGCYYFNDLSTKFQNVKTCTVSTVSVQSAPTISYVNNQPSTISSPPLSSSSLSFENVLVGNEMTANTCDLLTLAEVAANHTELIN